jgi:hypothetical protein
MPTLSYSPQMMMTAAAIGVLGLLVYGMFDVLRFSLARVMAVGKVLFKDALRKKILWVAPVVMLGVLVVVQLQRPVDELDAIRQTVKACLFASGLMVTLLMLILASTNLGRDIDSKVIFTIVTKPATRLELLLGKLTGFAMVSGLLLLLMAGFSYGLVQYKRVVMQQQITARLAAGTSDEFATSWLEHHQTNGLLRTVSSTRAAAVNVYSLAPEVDRVGMISSSQSAVIPFEVTPQELIPKSGGVLNIPGEAGLVLEIRVPFERIVGPFVFLNDPCQLAITIVNEFDELLIGPREINQGQPIITTDPLGVRVKRIRISEQAAQILARQRRFMIRIAPADSVHRIGIVDNAQLIVPAATPKDFGYLKPRSLFSNEQPQPIFRGGFGRRGQRVLGPGEGGASMVRFSLGSEQSPVPFNTSKVGEQLDLELRVGVDRAEDSADQPTRLRIRATDRITRAAAPDVFAIPENVRTTYVQIPKGPLESGQYDIDVYVETPGHAIEIEAGVLTQTTLSGSLVASKPVGSMLTNLLSAFAAQWLLAILIATLALGCSTFLSWPLALVLTVTILGSNWVVQQVGDALQAGIGARVAEGAGLRDTAAVQTVSAAVEGLSGTLRTVAGYLPNLDYFALGQWVERGQAVPLAMLGQALLTTLLFAVPTLSIAYVVLRNKEVAP